MMRKSDRRSRKDGGRQENRELMRLIRPRYVRINEIDDGAMVREWKLI